MQDDNFDHLLLLTQSMPTFETVFSKEICGVLFEFLTVSETFRIA